MSYANLKEKLAKTRQLRERYFGPTPEANPDYVIPKQIHVIPNPERIDLMSTLKSVEEAIVSSGAEIHADIAELVNEIRATNARAIEVTVPTPEVLVRLPWWLAMALMGVGGVAGCLTGFLIS